MAQADDVLPGFEDVNPATDAKQEAPVEDSSPVEETKPEVAPEAKTEPEAPAPKATAKEEVKAEEPKAETEAEADVTPESADETQAEEKPQDEELAPKSVNRFQKLANENRVLKEQIAELTSKVYVPQQPEDIEQEVNPETGEQYTRAEARIAAFEQRQELRDYTEKISENQRELNQESFEILNTFPIFNPTLANGKPNPEFKPELAEHAARVMEANLIRDPNIPEVDPSTGQPTGKGLPIGYHASPYQIYAPIAEAYELSAKENQIKGQKATEQMMASVDTPSSSGPETKQKDAFEEGFDNPWTK